MKLACYAVALAAVVVLVWPGSWAGQGVINVSSGLASTLRSST